MVSIVLYEPGGASCQMLSRKNITGTRAELIGTCLFPLQPQNSPLFGKSCIYTFEEAGGGGMKKLCGCAATSCSINKSNQEIRVLNINYSNISFTFVFRYHPILT